MFVWYALYFCLQSLDINIYLLFQQQILTLETGNFLWEMKSNTANFWLKSPTTGCGKSSYFMLKNQNIISNYHNDN